MVLAAVRRSNAVALLGAKQNTCIGCLCHTGRENRAVGWHDAGRRLDGMGASDCALQARPTILTGLVYRVCRQGGCSASAGRLWDGQFCWMRHARTPGDQAQTGCPLEF